MFREAYRKANDSVRAPASILAAAKARISETAPSAREGAVQKRLWPRVLGFSSAAVAVAALALVLVLPRLAFRADSVAPQAANETYTSAKSAELDYSAAASYGAEASAELPMTFSENRAALMGTALDDTPESVAFDTVLTLEADGVTYRLEDDVLHAFDHEEQWSLSLPPSGMVDPIPQYLLSVDGRVCVLADGTDDAGNPLIAVYGFAFADGILYAIEPPAVLDGTLEDAGTDGDKIAYIRMERTVCYAAASGPEAPAPSDGGPAEDEMHVYRCIDAIRLDDNAIRIDSISVERLP